MSHSEPGRQTSDEPLPLPTEQERRDMEELHAKLSLDLEIEAMETVAKATDHLDYQTFWRIMQWALSRRKKEARECLQRGRGASAGE